MRNLRTCKKADGLPWVCIVLVWVFLIIVLCVVLQRNSNSENFADAAKSQNITIIKVYDKVNPNTYSGIVDISGYEMLTICRNHNLANLTFSKAWDDPLYYFTIIDGVAYNYRP